MSGASPESSRCQAAAQRTGKSRSSQRFLRGSTLSATEIDPHVLACAKLTQQVLAVPDGHIDFDGGQTLPKKSSRLREGLPDRLMCRCVEDVLNCTRSLRHQPPQRILIQLEGHIRPFRRRVGADNCRPRPRRYDTAPTETCGSPDGDRRRHGTYLA